MGSAQRVVFMFVGCLSLSFILSCMPKSASGSAFSKAVTVAAGSFAEACAPLTHGQEFSYSFNASHPVDFDIHYHDADDKKLFPVKKGGVTRDQGFIIADVKTTYCMMWVNHQSGPVTISYEYHIPE